MICQTRPGCMAEPAHSAIRRVRFAPATITFADFMRKRPSLTARTPGMYTVFTCQQRCSNAAASFANQTSAGCRNTLSFSKKQKHGGICSIAELQQQSLWHTNCYCNNGAHFSGPPRVPDGAHLCQSAGPGGASPRRVLVAAAASPMATAAFSDAVVARGRRQVAALEEAANAARSCGRRLPRHPTRSPSTQRGRRQSPQTECQTTLRLRQLLR